MKKVWKSLIVGLSLLVIGALGFIAYQNFIKPLPLPKPSTSAGKLAECHLVGGFAGFCDHLVVYTDGSASIFNDCANEQEDFQVKSNVLNQLMSFSQQFSRFSSESEDNIEGPDSLYTKLIFYGQGSEQPEQEQEDIIIRLINSILIQNKL